MRIGVAVPLSGTVARLREAVSLETKIPTDQVVRLQTLIAQGSLEGWLSVLEFLTVLCQIWLDRNVKPVVSMVRKRKIKTQRRKIYTKPYHVSLIVYARTFLKGKAVTLFIIT